MRIRCVTCELASLQGTLDGVAIADFASGRIDKVDTAFHPPDHIHVEQPRCFVIQRAMNGHHVAHRDHCRSIRVIDEAQIILDRQGQPPGIGIMLPHVKRAQTPKDGKTNAASAKNSDVHPFEIISALGVIRDPLGLPVAWDD